MKREEVNILVIEDDASLGKAIVSALSRHEYKVSLASRPDEAFTLLKFQSFDGVIIDCMLPLMNGVEVAKKIRTDNNPNIKIVLTSGIFKDKVFQRDALQSTKAAAFINKPFEMSDFVKLIDTTFGVDAQKPKAMIHQFLAKEEITAKERMRAVDEADTIHGFDLPWIFSLLMYEKVSGHLNVISAEGNVSGVGFMDGNIVQVYLDDRRSFFGVLMVEYGFISQEELDEVTKVTGNAKKLGEKLVEANVLSPHAIQIVMAEQQNIRLSKIIAPSSFKVNFIEAEDMRVNAYTDRQAFGDLLNEWLVSKYSLDWLKSFYTQWMNFNLRKGPEWTPGHKVFKCPVVSRVGDITEILLTSPTLEYALSKIQISEEYVYRALHALIITRVIRFGERTARTDYASQRARLNGLLKSLEAQNHFERLGVSPKAKEAEINRAFHDLSRALDPNILPADAPQDLKNMTVKIFDMITKSHEILMDQDKKSVLLQDIEKSKAELSLAAANLAEQARPLLSTGEIKQATELLEKALDMASPSSETRLLHLWAKLRTPAIFRDKKALEGIRDDLAQIPPEDRHNATYFFVKALLLRATGDNTGAKRNLEHVLSQSPDFIDARRELNAVVALESEGEEGTKSVNILTGDLKDVVGMLFKKKKS